MDNPLAKGRTEPAAEPASTTPAQELPAKVGEKNPSDMYITYALDHDVPFIADYYGIGSLYDYKDLSYKSEVDEIDNYLVDEVKSKKLDNTTEAVKTRLKQLETIAGIDPIVPVSVRIKKLAAYAKYMQQLSKIDGGVVL